MGGSGPPLGGDRLGDDPARQLRRQLSQGLTDANDLRQAIDRSSTDYRNIDRVVGNLQRLNESGYDDTRRIAALKEAIDLLNQMEMNLSREYDRLNQQEKYFYAEDSEAPANYKKLVEEYYKALARTKP
jgi:chromosome condensin MukBEF ATPase and DNA-binding subunit MukB